MVCDKCVATKLSDYANTLNFDIQARYFDKTSSVPADPYVINQCKFECWRSALQEVPKLHFLNVYEYLVTRKSMYTHDEFLGYKGLNAYNYFVSGHLQRVRWLRICKDKEEKYLFSCTCKHSMRSNEADLILWLLVEQTKIVTAHCTCIAGLGECCSHVAALMFFINYASCKDDESVTSKLAYWVNPNASDKTIPKQLSQINFETPKNQLEGVEPKRQMIKLKVHPPPMNNRIEMISFLQSLKVASPNNATMYVVKELQAEVTPKCTKRKNITNDINVLKNLQNKISKRMAEEPTETKVSAIFLDSIESQKLLEGVSLNLLQPCHSDHCEFFNNNINLKTSAAALIFQETISQSNFEWRKQRQVRITGSIAYQLYTYSKGNYKNKNWQTKFESIIFSEFKGNDATDYGIANEGNACSVLKKKYAVLSKTGLLIPVHCPWYGFSADALIVWQDRYQLVEIKCPLAGKECSGLQLCQQVDFLKIEGENIVMKKRHRYYGQVQLGLFVYNLKIAKLVIYSSFDDSIIEINVTYDEEFVTKMITELNNMYFSHMLPFLYCNKDRLFISEK